MKVCQKVSPLLCLWQVCLLAARPDGHRQLGESTDSSSRLDGMGDEGSSEEDEWETDEEDEVTAREEEEVLEEAIEEGSPVQPGDVLVSARPFVYAIQQQYRSKVCERCFLWSDEWKGITLCSCQGVGYCSEQCRMADRERHRVECGLLLLRGNKCWPHRVTFLARACIRCCT